MIDLSKEEIRSAVRDRYGLIAREQSAGCCGPAASTCCGSPSAPHRGAASEALGYGIQDLNAVPEGSNLGLGCGNPQVLAALKPGEIVLDLGSGAGFDCFLASKSVGATGRVIGVDMTHDMLALARANALKGDYANVEFRLGEIEHLPVADACIDVILSNCVINLSPDKPQVFREAFRVLKRGGRLAISDVVASGPIPEAFRDDLKLHTSCVVGATPWEELKTMLVEAGFEHIVIKPKAESRTFMKDWVPGSGLEDYILSATIEGVKP